MKRNTTANVKVLTLPWKFFFSLARFFVVAGFPFSDNHLYNSTAIEAHYPFVSLSCTNHQNISKLVKDCSIRQVHTAVATKEVSLEYCWVIK